MIDVGAVLLSGQVARKSEIFRILFEQVGPGLLSRYSDSLRAGRSGNRVPVEARFSAPIQTGPGAHQASFTMGTGSFPGVKAAGA
jgi:hypothetical protein